MAAQDPASQCQGIRRDGKKCNRPVVNGQRYCWQHQPTIRRWLRRIKVGGIVIVVLSFISLVADLSGLGVLHIVNTVSAPTIPSDQEFRFVTESYVVKDYPTAKLYLTIWNQHPVQKIRVFDFRLAELFRIDNELYCCPEVRGKLTLDFQTQSARLSENEPLMETYEIPPRSSHSFLATVTTRREAFDGDPTIFFGVLVRYSIVSGEILEGRSDRVYVINNRGISEDSFDSSNIEQVLASSITRYDFGPSTRGWFLCPWSNTYLPGAFQVKGSETPLAAPTVVTAASPIAIYQVHRGYNKVPGEVAVRSVKALSEHEFASLFPTAVLSCDERLIAGKYDGRILQLIFSYTNKGNEKVFWYGVYSDWTLTDGPPTRDKLANKLIPQEIRERPLSSEYRDQKVYTMLETPNEFVWLAPGETTIRALYFQPIIGSANEVYIVSEDEENLSWGPFKLSR